MVVGRTHIPVVNKEICQTCSVCLRKCPAEFLPDLRYDEETTRGYLYKNSELLEKEKLPPCEDACPVGQKVREYAHLIYEGKLKDAVSVIRQDNPLPAVLGYVCHHPCEKACLRGSWDDPVSIRELKRYAISYEMDHIDEIFDILKMRKAPSIRKKVAIIGAGPAGLACSFELAINGVDVTIFDSLPAPGGMLRVGIPSFRLPREIIDHDVEMITKLGVKIEKGVIFGKDLLFDDLKKDRFDALIFAIGTHKSVLLDIPGEDNTENYIDCLTFLRKVNLGENVELFGNVIVVGGGNAAIDASRVAIRLGAKDVVVLYRRRKEDMPADELEIKAAEREGVKFRFQVIPIEILKENGRLKGLKCVATRFKEGEKGRKAKLYTYGEPFIINADFLIPAIGQRSELSFMKKEAISDKETILLEEDGIVKGYNEAIFAAGDGVTGPSTVAQAVASGKEIAAKVVNYLKRK